MKKSILIIITASILCACSFNEDIINKNEINVSNNTIDKISNFNDSLSLTNNVQTKGKWRFMQSLIIATADVMGAGAGIAAAKEIVGLFGAVTGGTGAAVGAGIVGVACGAAASYAAAGYIVVIPSSEVISDDNNLSLSLVFSAIPKGSFDGYTGPLKTGNYTPGEIHNLALDNLLEVGNDLTTRSADVVTQEKELEAQDNCNYMIDKLQEINFNIQDVNSVYNYVKTSITPYIKNNNYEEFIQKMKGDNMMTENTAKIYLLFIKLYESYPDDQGDVEYIVNKYKQIVEESEDLSSEEKDAIYMGLSVAISSSKFWENIQQ